MAIKKVEIKEFIQKMGDVKKWEDDNYKKTGKRRLPNYIIFKDGSEALIADWLDAVKRYSTWMAQNKVVPNYVNVKIRDKNTSAPGKQVYYYPTSTFTQDVGGGCFGCTWIPNKNKKHCGVDVDRMQIYLPVRAVTDGTVKYVSNNYRWDWVVCIEHPSIPGIAPEGWCSTNWHLERVPQQLKAGIRVKAGEQIGVIGRVEPHQWTGPAHLHFGVWKGKYNSNAIKGALNISEYPLKFIDPYNFLKQVDARK